ncbi:helix-turn-helix transcriptional regulator [Pseudoroseicyclus aestuarii]|uniref:helix-turn-helix transcriptional regulator n=1 Tax=Pseudoroseicyclus aestuarii TaxID=1795041 RepID=UPI0011B59F39|nr:helix-turn-helix transcriptional regulator [Pseudoroseicyclus aestuarii]
MTTLPEYLRDHGISQIAFARKVAASRSYVSEISNGIKAPSWQMALRIEAATSGAIPATSWPKFQPIAEHTAAPHQKGAA